MIQASSSGAMLLDNPVDTAESLSSIRPERTLSRRKTRAQVLDPASGWEKCANELDPSASMAPNEANDMP
jgi:hypothetical protein